jgi:transposase
MPAASTSAPLDAETRAEAERRYNTTTAANTRLRYHIIVLAAQGDTAPHLARLLLRSAAMVLRVRKRFRTGGLDAVPRRYAPGRARTVSPPWEAALLRVIERDRHEVGIDSAHWTTGLLADYLARTTGIAVAAETVRVDLPAHDYVCTRPTCTLKRKAQEQEGDGGNA